MLERPFRFTHRNQFFELFYIYKSGVGGFYEIFWKFVPKRGGGDGLSYVAKLFISGQLIVKEGSLGAQTVTTGREGASQLLI